MFARENGMKENMILKIQLSGELDVKLWKQNRESNIGILIYLLSET